MKTPLDYRIDKWIPTEDELKLIEQLSGLHLTIQQIAGRLNISKSTLELNIRTNDCVSQAIKNGKAKSQLMVSQAALKMASSGKNFQATAFWLSRKAGWVEPKEAPEEKFNEPPKVEGLDE